MKTAAIQKLRAKLAADEPAYGLWVTLDSPASTEIAAGLGLDWVVIDAEHGQLDWQDIVAHIRATVRSTTVALVRIAELNGALIKRALDIGADGVVIPWIETAEQVSQAVSFAHYPTRGVRSIGAERATAWGQCIPQHVAEAEANVLVVPMIETVEAGKQIDAILGVGGVDIFFLGTADYSSSAGHAGQFEAPEVTQEILKIKDRIRSRGKYAGVIATSPENLMARREQGFRMLALSLDTTFLIRGIRSSLAAVGIERRIAPDFAG